MGGEPPERARERKALAREAERRRRAATALTVTASTCSYAAAQLANGLGPQQARSAAREVAATLEATAAELRRLTRLRGPERRVLAVMLAGRGLPQREIALQLGVCDRTVRSYLAGRPGR